MASQMISQDAIISYIIKTIPDAVVTLTDTTGTMDHYRMAIVSKQFSGMNRLDRNRLVYQALNEPMKDGRIHAIEIQSKAPEEA